jgi:hypothetical protein
VHILKQKCAEAPFLRLVENADLRLGDDAEPMKI